LKAIIGSVARAVQARWDRWSRILRLLPAVGTGLLAATIAVNIILGLLPAGFIIAISVLVNRLRADAGQGLDAVVAPLLLAIGALAGQQLLAPFSTYFGEVVVRRVDEHCLRTLMTDALTGVPVAVLERQSTQDLLAHALLAFERQTWTPGDAAAGLLALINRYTQLVVACLLVAIVLSPWAGVAVVVTALVIRHGRRGTQGQLARLILGLSGARRRVAYLRRVAGSPPMAKEIRVLGLIGWFQDRHVRETDDFLSPLWAGRRRLLFRPFVVLAGVGMIGAGICLLLLEHAAVDGRLTLLHLAIAVQGVLIPLRFGVYFPDSDVQTEYGMQSADAITEFARLKDAAAADEAARPRAAADSAGKTVSLRKSIRFEDVVFRYAPGGEAVLDQLELEIEAGRSTAVVGLNGAGKTTLVKLLTRLYDPQSGAIRADGVDLREVDPEEWRRSFAVIFQDYIRYELSMAENIRMGSPEAPDSPATGQAVLRAVERAGAGSVSGRLPAGMGTVLSRQYPGGQDLSGGQWQRVALARAFFAVECGAQVLVLDEPTAQLDIRAEVEFFDRFLTMTEGITSVIISHRFSSVRKADRIVVLEHGRVVESGNHDELVALDGRYAGLFHLQASRFDEASADSRPEEGGAR
jgi:ATP-binding cassette, subfamily B, bacterial